MYVHEDTGRSFISLPPVFPEPWVPLYFHDEAEDYVCQNTDFGGPCQYSMTIPATPHGWKAAWDPERFDFLFYEHPEGTGYFHLNIPFLRSRSFLPTHDTYTKADIQEAYRRFARLNHPDKGGDLSVFTETQQYFKLALQEFDDFFQDIEGEYSDEDAPRVVWDVDAADFFLEDASTGQQIDVHVLTPLSIPLQTAKPLMLEDNACPSAPNIGEIDEVSETNASALFLSDNGSPDVDETLTADKCHHYCKPIALKSCFRDAVMSLAASRSCQHVYRDLSVIRRDVVASGFAGTRRANMNFLRIQAILLKHRVSILVLHDSHGRLNYNMSGRSSSKFSRASSYF